MKKVTIIGAGWLGLNLAKFLQQDSYRVFCSYRNKALELKLKKEKIDSFFLNLNEDILPAELFDTDTLCIFIPPSQNANYEKIFLRIIEHKDFSKIKQLIFSSSTSVYIENHTKKYENSPLKTDNQIVEVENILKKLHNAAILRFAGLMGEKRYLAKYYNATVPNAQTTVNHIHLEDAVGILERIISKNILGIYNICAPLHPTKKDIITQQCKILNKKLPYFEKGNSKKAIVITDKIDKKISYMYRYSNPIDFPLIENQAPF